MTITEHSPIVPRSLVERVKAILLRPKETWDVIDAEPATIKGLYRDYFGYIAVIGPICMWIGDVVFFHANVIGGFIAAAIGYALALAVAYGVAFVIDKLAPYFGGAPNRVQAFKVAVYAATPGEIAGVVNLVPALAILELIAAAYGVYLLWLGLPKLMRVPQDKALTYFAAVLGVMLVAAIVLSALVWPLVGRI